MKLGRNTRRRLVFYGGLLAFLGGGALYFTSMPGWSFVGAAPPLDARERKILRLVRSHVEQVAGTIGERNTRSPDKLHAAADYIDATLRRLGYTVSRYPYVADGVTCDTLTADMLGDPPDTKEVVLVGAHYDSALGAPGADDNGSGVAAALALAGIQGDVHQGSRTVRFAFFPNEEPPFFATDQMGSLVYARLPPRAGERIVAMLSLESVGYFSSAPHSQRYPGVVSLFYPERGDFVAFVGDLGSRGLVRRAIGEFRKTAHVPSEGAALPAWVPGVDWSDHRSYRAVGVPAIMVTDTAVFRNPAYHTARDTIETVDYDTLARVVAGVADVVNDLANP